MNIEKWIKLKKYEEEKKRMKFEKAKDILDLHQAPIAQSVERSAVNRKVVGSIPTGSDAFFIIIFLFIKIFNFIEY